MGIVCMLTFYFVLSMSPRPKILLEGPQHVDSSSYRLFYLDAQYILAQLAIPRLSQCHPYCRAYSLLACPML